MRKVAENVLVFGVIIAFIAGIGFVLDDGNKAATQLAMSYVGKTIQVESSQMPQHTFEFTVTSASCQGLLGVSTINLYGILTVEQLDGHTCGGASHGSTVINWLPQSGKGGESWFIDDLHLKGLPSPERKIKLYITDVKVK